MNYLSYFWIAIIVITAVFEAMTAGLITIWFTLGAVIAFFISLFCQNVYIQFLTFLISSVLALIFTAPLVKNRTLYKKEKTNADSVLGKEALVIETINPTEGTGQVKVEGVVWSAKANRFIAEGETVKVTEIKGVKLFVEQEI